MTDYPRYIGHVLVHNAEDEAAEIARQAERTETKPKPTPKPRGRKPRG